MDDQQSAADAEAKVAAAKERVASEQVVSRSLTSSALQMMAQHAEAATMAFTTTAAGTAGVHYTKKLLNRPAEEPTRPIEVEKGYRPKED